MLTTTNPDRTWSCRGVDFEKGGSSGVYGMVHFASFVITKQGALNLTT